VRPAAPQRVRAVLRSQERRSAGGAGLATNAGALPGVSPKSSGRPVSRFTDSGTHPIQARKVDEDEDRSQGDVRVDASPNSEEGRVEVDNVKEIGNVNTMMIWLAPSYQIIVGFAADRCHKTLVTFVTNSGRTGGRRAGLGLFQTLSGRRHRRVAAVTNGANKKSAAECDAFRKTDPVRPGSARPAPIGSSRYYPSGI
jgi:hypothetical protein